MCNCMKEHCSLCHHKWVALQKMVLEKALSDSLEVDTKYFKSLPAKANEYTPDLYNSIMSSYMCYATDNGIKWSYPQLFSRTEMFPPEDEFLVKFGWFQYEYLCHVNSPFAERLKPEPMIPNSKHRWMEQWIW